MLLLFTLTLTARASGAQPIGFGEPAPSESIDLAAEHEYPIDLWGNDRTLWVVDNGPNKLFAYDRRSGQRDPARDIDIAQESLTGVWSDGETIWVLAYWGGAFAYDLETGARSSSQDRRGVGQQGTFGLWSNGETAWVSSDAVDRLFAYSWSSGERDPDRDIATGPAGSYAIRGLWSDGATMWVSDLARNKLFAYSLADGTRLPGRDLDGLSASGIDSPTGLWSDHATMWVADRLNRKLTAYRVGAPFLTSLDLSGLQIGPFDRFETEYVADLTTPLSETTVAATPVARANLEILPADADSAEPGHQIDLSGLEQGRSLDVELSVTRPGSPGRTYSVDIHLVGQRTDATLSELQLSGVDYGPFDPVVRHYRATVGFAVATTTVAATPAASGASVRLEAPDADPIAPGHQIQLAQGSNSVRVTVTAPDGTTTRVYSVEITRLSGSRDARLLSLSVDGVDIGPFSSDVLGYRGRVPIGLASTTVRAEPVPGASAVITPSDADTDEPGHQVALPPDQLTILVTVTAEAGAPTKVYRVVLSPPLIGDANLLSQVRHALNLPASAPVTTEEMASLVTLDLSRTEVTDLSALEYAVNLRELFLGNNRSADLSPLAGLGVSIRYTHGPGLPNRTWSGDELWKPLSTVWAARPSSGHGVGFMVDGHLVLISHNESLVTWRYPTVVEVWDISQPRQPRMVRLHRSGVRRLREAHGLGLWNRDGRMILAAQTHRGVAFYDVTDIREEMTLLGELHLYDARREGYDGSWWVGIQAPYVYVGAVGGGLFVVDASDPSNPLLVRQLHTGELSGVSPGSVFAVGGLLVLAEPGGQRYATMDISNPADPVLIEVGELEKGYSHMFTAGLLLSSVASRGVGRMRVYRVGHDGRAVYAGQAGDRLADGGYGAYKDGYFLGGFSTKVAKFTIDPPAQVGSGSSKAGNRDEDFVSPLGNLVFVGDDHGVGSSLMAHETGPDTRGPMVHWVHPANGAADVRTTTPIGASMSEEIAIESLIAERFRVRPRGGEPVSGRLSASLNNLNFVPDTALAPATVYEVEVCGLSDLVGNTGGCDTSAFTTADAGSDPPTCRIGPFDPIESGAQVDYVPAATTGGPTSYTWDFGDGQTAGPFSTERVTVTHAAPGRHSVVLTVTNAHGTRSCGAVRIVHDPVSARGPTGVGGPVSSSSIAVAATQSGTDRLGEPTLATDVYVANSDNNSVTRIDRLNRKVWETRVGETPRTLTIAPNGNIWVANEGSGEIVVLNRSGAVVETIALGYGVAPYGIVFAPDGSAAYVTLTAAGRLLKLSPAGVVTGDLAIGPSPRGIAVSGDSRRVLVTRFVSGYVESDGIGTDDARGEVYEIDAASFTVLRTLELGFDPGPDGEFTGRGVPNYLSQVRIAPDGATAWIPSKKDNIARGSHRDGNRLDFETQTRPIVSQIDLVTGAEAPDSRIDLNDRDLPQAMVFTPRGDAFVVAFQGSNVIEVWDANTRQRLSQTRVGLTPIGLAMRPDGRRLYVHNFLDRSVSIFDTGRLVTGVSGQPVPITVVGTVGQEALEPAVLRGKRLFYNAADPRMSRDGYISCASCHLDGGSDGMVWDRTQFGEGLRNTIDLRGRRGTNGGFVHWSANFDEIQDFEHDMRNAFGGTGFMSDSDFAIGTRSDPLGDSKTGVSSELDDLAAYVTSLAAYPDSPHRQADGSLTDAGIRGRAVFAAKRCSSCHEGADFTDDARHDVGTLDASSGSGRILEGVNTPTLMGLWETGPYLHNGSASTLSEVLGNALHMGGGLTEQERADLKAYLLQIDGNEVAEAGEPLLPGTLRSMVFSGIELGPFDPNTTAYTVSVPPLIGTTTVTVATSEPGAVVEIAPPDSDATLPGHQVTLATGANVVTITVTAADGQTTRTYTVTLNRGSSAADASLGTLTLGGVDFGAFDPLVTSYAAGVDSGVTSTTLTAVASAPGATVAIAPADADAGTEGHQIGLERGVNVITITVTAEDGTTTETYTVAVTRAASADASLRELALSGVDFGVFDPLVTSYAAGVGAGVETTTLTAAASAAGATVAIAPADADAGTGGHQIRLARGVNVITITVTAEDGTTTRPYTVTVTRAASADASLRELTLSGVDFGVFDPLVTSYAAGVGAGVETTTLNAAASAAGATVAIAPADADTGTGGHQIRLERGVNVIAITVTAEDGTTTETYTVTVTRASVPLTARFTSLPSSHGGEGTVVLRVEFSEPVGTSYAALRDAAFTVTNGAVDEARRVDGRNDLWEIEIAPSSHAELLVVLPVTTDCEVAGAVCTADGRPLSNRLEAAIPGPAPLTARFASLPSSHAGEGTVVLRVEFSEPVGTGYAALRDAAFTVTNGAVRAARRVDGRSDLWEIEIAPSSDAELLVVLPVTTDCEVGGGGVH